MRVSLNRTYLVINPFISETEVEEINLMRVLRGIYWLPIFAKIVLKNTPDWIRTNDLPLRRRLLYPAELPRLTFSVEKVSKKTLVILAFCASSNSTAQIRLYFNLIM